MGSIASALTGSGSRKAADAQAGAAADAIKTQTESLNSQLKLSRESLLMQKEMLQQALSYGDPYRDAGNRALAQYESLIYGIPITETESYKSVTTPTAPPEGAGQFLSKQGFAQELMRKYTTNDDIYRPGTQLWADTNGLIGRSGQIPLGVSVTGDFDENQFQQDVDSAWEKYRTSLGVSNEAAPVEPPDWGETIDYRDTPGYEFRRDEGQKALERSAAARSGVLTGAAIKATERYGQDFATNEFDNTLRRLAGIIDTGANMSGAAAGNTLNSANSQSGVLSNMAGAYGNYGNNVGALQTQIGAARASGYLGTQAAGTNILNMASSIAGSYFGGG